MNITLRPDDADPSSSSDDASRDFVTRSQDSQDFTLKIDPSLGGIAPGFGRAARGVTRLVAIFPIIFGATFAAIGGAIFATNLANSQKFTAKTRAVVTGVDEQEFRDDDGDHYSRTTECAPRYRYVVDGKNYSRSSTAYSDANCDIREGDSVSAKYDPKSPDQSALESEVSGGAIAFSLIFVIVGVVAIGGGAALLIFARKWHRAADDDGDGLGNDAAPATAEQMQLIENGMRELGQFYIPGKRLTQSEARETLRDIEAQRTKANNPSENLPDAPAENPQNPQMPPENPPQNPS